MQNAFRTLEAKVDGTGYGALLALFSSFRIFIWLKR